MRGFLAVAVAIWLAALPPVGAADAARELQWSDLVPPLEKFDDPFVALSSEQKLDLSLVAAARQLEARRETLPPERAETVRSAQARLQQARIDVDGLLARRAEIAARRRQAAETVNPALNGQQVRIPGYVLPLESDARRVTEFLLVPYVGACIHAPTPPPNQIVHVTHAQGFESAGTFAPVWVRGELRTVRSDARLNLVDGSASIPTGYALKAVTVEPYRQ